MAYKIQYTPEDNLRYPNKKQVKLIHWKRWICVGMFLAGFLWVRHNGIPDFLIPGDPEITTVAAKNMLENLRQGTSINDAVSVFCKDILAGAGF